MVEFDLLLEKGGTTQEEIDALNKFTGFTSWPKNCVGRKLIGGNDALHKAAEDRSLWPILDKAGITYDAG